VHDELPVTLMNPTVQKFNYNYEQRKVPKHMRLNTIPYKYIDFVNLQEAMHCPTDTNLYFT
jgi:hypothetical protein